MTVDAARIDKALIGMMQAAALGAGWRAALTRLAAATDSRGAVLMRCGADGGPRHVVVTSEIDEHCAAYFDGDRPADSRQKRVIVGMEKGFLADYDSYAAPELDRDPFYQEFLRPRGFYWHAVAMLAGRMGDDVDIGFRRAPSQGHFTPRELAVLDAALPALRAVTVFAADMLKDRDEHALAAAARRGQAAWLVGPGGSIAAANAHAESSAALAVSNGRLTAREPSRQRALDRALHAAAARPATVALADAPAGRRFTLALMPVVGEARNVFGGARAIATLVEHGAGAAPPPALCEALADCYGLTGAERRLLDRLAAGATIETAAAVLGVSAGTARNHAKSILRKTECRRQTELMLLLKNLEAAGGW